MLDMCMFQHAIWGKVVGMPLTAFPDTSLCLPGSLCGMRAMCAAALLHGLSTQCMVNITASFVCCSVGKMHASYHLGIPSHPKTLTYQITILVWFVILTFYLFWKWFWSGNSFGEPTTTSSLSLSLYLPLPLPPPTPTPAGQWRCASSRIPAHSR